MTTAPHALTDAPAPGTEAWNATITASKVPPMITLSDGAYAGYGHLTAWEQFEEIKGRYTREISDYLQAIFDAAHDREQPAIEQWVEAQENPHHWEIHLQEAWTNPQLPFSNFATLDARAYNTETNETRALEVKSPISGGRQTGWVIQSVAQHIMSGIENVDLIVYPFSADTITTYTTDLNSALVSKVRGDMEAFYKLLQDDTPPPGGDVQVDAATYEKIKALKAAEKKAKEDYEKAKADLIAYVRKSEAKRAVHGDERVATLVDGRFAKSRVPDEYAEILTGDDVTVTTTKLDEKKLKKKYPWVYASGLGDPYLTISRNI